MVEQKSSSFQRYFNSLTFYLFTLSVKCKHLEDFDEDGPFVDHYKNFFQIKTKLNSKIIDDERLLINKDIFNEYFDSLSKMDFNQEDYLIKIKKFNKKFKYKKEEITKLYFELSNNLPKSKIRRYGDQLINWSFPALVIVAFVFLVTFIIAKDWKYFLFPAGLFIDSLLLLFTGISKLIALKTKKITNFKFNNLYSSDYCFLKIQESEKFFREVYKINNDYFDISYLEINFPEYGNLFERTISSTNLSDSNKEKLLTQNKNLYVRAVFSDFFDLLSKEKIDQYQQIPFMFVATLKRANISIQGNTAFTECVNHILQKQEFTDTTFNQAKAKYKNEEDIFDKYRNILKKYENILQ